MILSRSVPWNLSRGFPSKCFDTLLYDASRALPGNPPIFEVTFPESKSAKAKRTPIATNNDPKAKRLKTTRLGPLVALYTTLGEGGASFSFSVGLALEELLLSFP